MPHSTVNFLIDSLAKKNIQLQTLHPESPEQTGTSDPLFIAHINNNIIVFAILSDSVLVTRCDTPLIFLPGDANPQPYLHANTLNMQFPGLKVSINDREERLFRRVEHTIPLQPICTPEQVHRSVDYVISSLEKINANDPTIFRGESPEESK